MKKHFILLFFLSIFSLGTYAQPKYVFYFIGDGMGFAHVRLTQMYLADLQGKIGCVPLQMTTFPVAGAVSTHSLDFSITDSAASGTALASGQKTKNGMLGMDAGQNVIENISEWLKNKKWSIGIITTCSIDHATPGAFYAHVASRKNSFVIGTQLAQSGFDFFAGSTFVKPNGKIKKDTTNLYGYCQNRGYTFARGYENALEKISSNKMILINHDEGYDINKPGIGRLPYYIERQDTDLTLPKMVSAGIEFLEKKEQPFFIMAEAGTIDWHAHSNDAIGVIGSVMELDSAVRVAYHFYKKHPEETLILVTADHETGGLTLGKEGKGSFLNLKILKNQKITVDSISNGIQNICKQAGKKLQWQQVKDYLTATVGLYNMVSVTQEEDALLQEKFLALTTNKDKKVKNLYSEVNEISNLAIKIINAHAYLGWTTTSHTAGPVPLFALGKGAENFGGWIDNTDITPRLKTVIEPPIDSTKIDSVKIEVVEKSASTPKAAPKGEKTAPKAPAKTATKAAPKATTTPKTPVKK